MSNIKFAANDTRKEINKYISIGLKVNKVPFPTDFHFTNLLQIKIGVTAPRREPSYAETSLGSQGWLTPYYKNKIINNKILNRRNMNKTLKNLDNELNKSIRQALDLDINSGDLILIIKKKIATHNYNRNEIINNHFRS